MTTIALFQRSVRIRILKIIPCKKFNTISILLDRKINEIFYIAIYISNNSKYHLKELKNLKLKDTYYFKCNEIHKYLFSNLFFAFINLDEE